MSNKMFIFILLGIICLTVIANRAIDRYYDNEIKTMEASTRVELSIEETKRFEMLKKVLNEKN